MKSAPGTLTIATRRLIRVLVGAGKARSAQANAAILADIDVDAALISAAKNGLDDLVKLALCCGANQEARDRDENKTTALMRAAGKGCGGPALMALITRGVDLDARDQFGRTALMWAAYEGRPEAVRVLLSAGANSHLKDNREQTALMLAMVGFAPRVIKTFIAEILATGSALHERDEAGQTALMQAIASSNVAAARLLIDRGADVNAQDVIGMTALALLAFKIPSEATTECLVLLIDCGADPTIVDEEGRTVLDVLDDCHATELVAALDSALVNHGPQRTKLLATLSPSRRLTLLPKSCTAEAATTLSSWRRPP